MKARLIATLSLAFMVSMLVGAQAHAEEGDCFAGDPVFIQRDRREAVPAKTGAVEPANPNADSSVPAALTLAGGDKAAGSPANAMRLTAYILMGMGAAAVGSSVVRRKQRLSAQ